MFRAEFHGRGTMEGVMGWDRGCDGGDLGGRFGFSGWGWGLMGMGGRCPLEAELPPAAAEGALRNPPGSGVGRDRGSAHRGRGRPGAPPGISQLLPAPAPPWRPRGPAGLGGPGGSQLLPPPLPHALPAQAPPTAEAPPWPSRKRRPGSAAVTPAREAGPGQGSDPNGNRNWNGNGNGNAAQPFPGGIISVSLP